MKILNVKPDPSKFSICIPNPSEIELFSNLTTLTTRILTLKSYLMEIIIFGRLLDIKYCSTKLNGGPYEVGTRGDLNLGGT